MADASSFPATTQEHLQLPIELIDDSRFQKGRVSERGDLDELAKSMRDVGVLEPAIVRRVGDRYELVCGHRRKRGAIRAGLTMLPCLVGDYTDDQVLEIQTIENSQRADVHPLDEADNFAELVKRGRTTTEIADKIGRSLTYVTQRLQLCQLTAKGRLLLDGDKLTIGAALIVARVPTEKQQDEALDVLLEQMRWRRGDGGSISAADAKEVIEEKFMLRLKEAPWNLEDAELVPKAGACTTCTKRTGNQRELFSDVKSPDLCTDPKCHRTKLDEHWKIRKKEAKTTGATLVDGGAAKKLLQHGSGFVRLEGQVYGKNYKAVAIKGLVKKAELPITVVQDPRTGEHVELVREADAQKAAGRDEPSRSPRGGTKDVHVLRAETEGRKRKRLVELTLEQAVAAAEKVKTDEVLTTIVRGFVMRVWNDTQKAVLNRRGIEAAKTSRSSRGPVEEALLKHLDGLTLPQVRGLAIELALHMMQPSTNSKPDANWGPTLKALGVNLPKLEKQVATEEAERAKKKRAQGAKKAPKTPTKAKRAKAVKAPVERWDDGKDEIEDDGE